jgi:hypothetical protein
VHAIARKVIICFIAKDKQRRVKVKYQEIGKDLHSCASKQGAIPPTYQLALSGAIWLIPPDVSGVIGGNNE